MAEQVVIEFVGDASSFNAVADDVISKLKKSGEITDQQAASFKKDTDALKTYLNQEKGLIGATETALKSLYELRRKSNDPAQIKAYNAEIEKGTKKINDLTGATQKSHGTMRELKGFIGEVGIALGLAFSVEKIIEFGKKSIEAFDESIQGESALLNALNGRKDIQEELIAQANILQEKTGVQNDVIIAQQAFLAAQGRTTEQIKKTIEAAIQFSSVTKQDLATSVKQLDATLEGTRLRLGKYDERIKALTQNQLRNGEAIDIINSKYKGFAETALAAGLGPIKALGNSFNDLEEQIGHTILKQGSFISSLNDVIKNLSASFSTIEELRKKSQEGLNSSSSESAVKDFEELAEKYKKLGLTRAKAFEDYIRILNDDLKRAGESRTKILKELTGDEFIAAEGANKSLIESLKAQVKAVEEAFNAPIKAKESSIKILSDEITELKQQLEEMPLNEVFAPVDQGAFDELVADIKKKEDILKKLRDSFSLEAEKKAREEAQRLSEETSKNQEMLRKQMVKDETATIDAVTDARIVSLSKELLTTEDFNNKKTQIEIDGLKEQLKLDELNFDERAAILKKLAELQVSLNRSANDKILEDDKILFDALVKAAEQSGERQSEQYFKNIEDRKKIETEFLNTLTDAYQTFFELQIQDNRKQLDKQIEMLQEKRDAELRLAGDSATERDRINKDFDTRERALKRKAFEDSKKLQEAEAIIGAALAIVEIFAQPGVNYYVKIAQAAATAAALALQIVKIENTDPGFFKGVEYLKGRGTATSDSIPARLSVGERVVTADTNKAYYPTLTAIHNKRIPSVILNDFVTNLGRNPRPQPISITNGFDYHALARALKENNVVNIGNVGEIAKALNQPHNPYYHK